MRFVVFDKMDECTEAEVQRMLPLVSATRREQALRYKHTFGQFCCLKSWLMLQEREWLPNEQWAYNEHGKPYIPNGLEFSISHCKEGIAVAVDAKPIGIDIEGIRHAEEDLIRRVMNAEEQEKVRSGANEQEQARIFTRLWTQKEALVKAQGVGIASFEQLQQVLAQNDEWTIETHEEEKYIYSIAYKK
jgi:4'-phosphopantetheinyl transferase